MAVPPRPPSNSPSTSTVVAPSYPSAPSQGAAPAHPSAPPPAKPDPYIGKTIDGRYIVDRLLGEGGMGIVYAGRHKVIDKKVAIKVLRGEMAADRELTERFLQEARSASAIGNAHIVDISDFGQLPDGSTYFVMELLDGMSLSRLMSENHGAVPVPRLIHIAKQIAQGLGAAHAASIVHRDLKPDNVMVINRGTDKDFVKILDFGIAKVGGAQSRMTRAGSVFGTPHYMSPEQAAGSPVDHRTDIYALGVILYEMASSKVPFDADNFMGILTQHMYKAPVPLRALVPAADVPAGLDAIVLKSLTKKAEGRYATMSDLVEDLEKLERGVMPGAVEEMMARSGAFNVPADYFRSAALPAPVPAAPRLARKTWPIYAVIGAVGTILAAVVLVFALKGSGDDKARASLPTAAPPPSVPAATTSAPAVTPPPPPVDHEVIVSTSPGDATVTRDGANVGSLPLVLHMGDGETATLVVSRKGYKTKTVTLDGNTAKVTVALDSIFGSAAGGSPRPPAGPKHGGGIDDVGDPFAKHGH